VLLVRWRRSRRFDFHRFRIESNQVRMLGVRRCGRCKDRRFYSRCVQRSGVVFMARIQMAYGRSPHPDVLFSGILPECTGVDSAQVISILASSRGTSLSTPGLKSALSQPKPPGLAWFTRALLISSLARERSLNAFLLTPVRKIVIRIEG
jgi:hypothetical protein